MAYRSSDGVRRGFADELAKLAVSLKVPSAMPPSTERGLEKMQRRGLAGARSGFESVAAKPVKIEKSWADAVPPKPAGS